MVLLEELHDARTAVEFLLGLRVEVGAELGEGLKLAVLGEVELGRSGYGFNRLRLGGGADTGNGETDRDRGTDALVEKVGFQVDLAVGDGDHVCRDVGGNVARLRFNDGKGGKRAAACCIREASGALEEAGVEVENVTGISFATGRAAEDQGHLAVGHGVLGKVVEHDEAVLALVHEVFRDGATGIRGEVLHRGGIRGGSGDDGGVFHRAGVFEGLLDPGDVGELLADGDVDAIHRLVVLQLALLGGLVLLRLGNDRVHGDGGFAGGAVADDQLALATADRHHRVDRHDPGLHGDRNGFPLDDAGSDFLHRVARGGGDLAFAVDRGAEGVDDSAEEGLADGDGKELAGGAAGCALGDRCVIAKEDDADFAFLKVERHAGHAAVELDHFIEHDVGKAFDDGDAVTDLADRAGVGFLNARANAGDLCFDVLEDAAHFWKVASVKCSGKNC